MHGFYVMPEGDGPWPVLVRPHGGPTWLDEDRFSPEVQAYVDAGLAVAMINYRGSTGYGAEWRDALIGDIGGPDLEDLNAGLSHLVVAGIADPARAAVGGWSWGGYLTLMELGSTRSSGCAASRESRSGTTPSATEDLSPNLAGLRPRPARRRARGRPRADAGSQPDHVRRPGPRFPSSS